MKDKLRALELERAKIDGKIELIQELLSQTKEAGPTKTEEPLDYREQILKTNLLTVRGRRTQKQMARLIGITPPAYGYIERKQFNAVHNDHIRKVSEWLQQH